jgi:putative ABC transport system permease protein
MSVSERTREMGLRLALGATPRGIVTNLMRSAGCWRHRSRARLIGAVVARAMAGLLFGLSPSDPITFFIVPLVLALVVVAATWSPARRAARLEPMSALRSD